MAVPAKDSAASKYCLALSTDPSFKASRPLDNSLLKESPVVSGSLMPGGILVSSVPALIPEVSVGLFSGMALPFCPLT